MTSVLQFAGVEKQFDTVSGPIEVLKGVDLAVEQGEFIAITGPSGSGKSTLLHLAALLDQPTTGAVYFDGQSVQDLNEAELCELRKLRVGMVFQKYCLLPHRSVLENVMFRYRYIPHDREAIVQRARDVLQSMGLGGVLERPARVLSGGEMQRVAIARAVLLPPHLLVADEPTGNLDTHAARTVMEGFQRLHADGLTILLVTHNEALLDYCTRHLVCSDGQLQAA